MAGEPEERDRGSQRRRERSTGQTEFPDRRRSGRKSLGHRGAEAQDMATYVAPIPQVSAHGGEDESKQGWTSWLTTTDHKKIGIMYMVTTFVFFCLGGVEALMIRLQ